MEMQRKLRQLTTKVRPSRRPPLLERHLMRGSPLITTSGVLHRGCIAVPAGAGPPAGAGGPGGAGPPRQGPPPPALAGRGPGRAAAPDGACARPPWAARRQQGRTTAAVSLPLGRPHQQPLPAPGRGSSRLKKQRMPPHCAGARPHRQPAAAHTLPAGSGGGLRPGVSAHRGAHV